ncbi:hypothetical protein SMICM304S_11481 [Streptomyces microflavus]
MRCPGGALPVGEDHRAGPVGRGAGLGVADRVPEHGGGLDLLQGDAGVVDVRVGVLERVAAVLVRDEGADRVGGSRTAHVRAHVRGEEAAGSGQQGLLEGDGQGEPPHGVGLGLFLEGEGQDGPVDAGGDEVGGDECGRAADRARRVDAEHRLADGSEGVREIQLRHHDALEEVGRLADDDGVDVAPGQSGVLQGTDRRLADQSGDGDVVPGGDVLGLADADDGDGLLRHARSPLPGRRPGSAAGRARRWRGRGPGRTRRGGCGRRPRRAG